MISDLSWLPGCVAASANERSFVHSLALAAIQQSRYSGQGISQKPSAHISG